MSELSNFDKIYLADIKKLASQIASIALKDALKRTTESLDEITDISLISRKRIQEIVDEAEGDITLSELALIGLGMDMLLNIDFESLR